MGKLNREDYRTAIPQLEKMLVDLIKKVDKLDEKNKELEKRVKALEGE